MSHPVTSVMEPTVLYCTVMYSDIIQCFVSFDRQQWRTCGTW